MTTCAPPRKPFCNLLAKEDQVVASKAKIGLFFQNPEATKLFEEVNAYGEELRNKRHAPHGRGNLQVRYPA